ncbi:MAG: carbamoyl-phosphate synthase small subunit [Oscillospiraceae bacterium]|nr:carbamoyl-phosphate synthase small subunit [Oscillospiraceae bacterium]
MKKAYLQLENGNIFEGELFGKDLDSDGVTGEVVFTTAMTGYLETITDPNYHGQIIVQTFPLIGNYGVIPSDLESDSIHAKAYIVKHLCQDPSNFRSEGSLDVFFEQKGVTVLCGIDTRALTKIIREQGVMNGKICAAPPTEADISAVKAYKIEGAVAAWQPKRSLGAAFAGHNIAVFPYGTSAQSFLASNPSGIVLAGGAGDPDSQEFAPVVEQVKALLESGKPILGVGLGHQLLAIAHGYKTEKLKFGHRGANTPVKDLATGRVYMTAQNHGYAVIADKGDKRLSFVNVNDGTCEGLDYRNSGGNAFGVQFYPFGNSADTAFIADRFVELVERKGG